MLCASLYLIIALSSLFSNARIDRVYSLSSMCGRWLSSSRSFAESRSSSNVLVTRPDLSRISSYAFLNRATSRDTCFSSSFSSSMAAVFINTASFCRNSLPSSRNRRISSLLAVLFASSTSMFDLRSFFRICIRICRSSTWCVMDASPPQSA